MAVGSGQERGRRGRADPLSQIAYDRIIALLSGGTLTLGQFLSQRELVEATGTTLAAVRETVPRLEAEGLIHAVPQRGLRLPSLDVDFIRDAYGMRSLIELNAVPAVIARVEASERRRWLDWHEAALTRLAALVAGDPERDAFVGEIQLADWNLHARFVDATGNGLMRNVYRTTAIKVRMVAQSWLKVTPFNASRVLSEHIGFLRPLADGAVERTRDHLGAHIEVSLRQALGDPD